MNVLGIDTSNYTTSIAVYNSDACTLVKKGILLSVAEGARGLRQSDAVFSHTKNLPELFSNFEFNQSIDAVAVSVSPREEAGSYMPCFLSGVAVANAIAAVNHVPVYCLSHQQGHVAAVLYSAGKLNMLRQPMLAWHLSGGTTELLLVEPTDSGIIHCSRIGGTMDASAGQVIDRTGVKMGLRFPCGKEMDGAALSYRDKKSNAVLYRNKLEISLSGLENQAEKLINQGVSVEETSAYVFSVLANSVIKVTQEAKSIYGDLPVVFSGGVSGSKYMKTVIEPKFDCVFGAPDFSADNAAGISVLGAILAERK